MFLLLLGCLIQKRKCNNGEKGEKAAINNCPRWERSEYLKVEGQGYSLLSCLRRRPSTLPFSNNCQPENPSFLSHAKSQKKTAKGSVSIAPIMCRWIWIGRRGLGER